MVEPAPLARPALDVGEEVSSWTFNGGGRCAPILARPRADSNDATWRGAIDEEQQLRLPLAAADEQLQSVARGRVVVQVERRHRTSRRSATIAPKRSAR